AGDAVVGAAVPGSKRADAGVVDDQVVVRQIERPRAADLEAGDFGGDAERHSAVVEGDAVGGSRHAGGGPVGGDRPIAARRADPGLLITRHRYDHTGGGVVVARVRA